MAAPHRSKAVRRHVVRRHPHMHRRRQQRPQVSGGRQARAANTRVWLNGLSASRVESEDSCRKMSQSDRASGRGVSESQQLASLAGRETAIGGQHLADTRGCHTNFGYSLNKAVEHPTCQSKTEAATARPMAVGAFVAATSAAGAAVGPKMKRYAFKTALEVCHPSAAVHNEDTQLLALITLFYYPLVSPGGAKPS